MREIEKKHSAVRHFAKLPASVLVAGALSAQPVLAEDMPTSAPQAIQAEAAAREPAALPSAPGAAPADEQVLPTVSVKASRVASDPNGTADTYVAPYTTVGRMPQAQRDLPQASTSITRGIMDDRDANTLKEALYNAPGITFNASEGGNSGDGIVMRGFGASNDIYLDNFRDSAQYNRDTFYLDRTEVLRGPASMMYGRGSTGGIINQVSKAPFASDLYTVSGTVGTHDFYRYEADLNKQLSDTAGMRVNLMQQQAGSYREGAEQNRWGVAPSFKFGIGEPTEVTLSFLHYVENNVPDYGVPYYGSTPIPFSDKFYGLTALDSENNEVNVGTVEVQHRVNASLLLKNTTRWGQYDTDLRASAPSLTGSTATGYVFSEDSVIGRSRKLRLREQEIASNVSEALFNVETAGLRHDVLAGLEITREKLTTTTRGYASGTCTLPSTTVGNPDPNVAVTCPDLVATGYGDVVGDTLAAYVQDQITLSPQWKVVAGARFDDFSVDVQTRALNGTLSNLRSRHEKMWSSRAGLIWQPDDRQSYYVSYGTSFNPSAESYAIDPAGSNTDPEKNINYEIGAKWDLLDKALSLRTALFKTIKTNERQTDITDYTPSTDYLLSGKRSTTGIEVEAAGLITDRWQVFAGYSWMDPRIDESNRPENVGKVPPNAPNYTANLWTTYELDSEWKVGFGGNAQGKRYADRYSNGSVLTNTKWLPAFVRWDASLEYKQGPVSAQLNVYNLADTEYFEGFYPGFATPGPRRSAKVTVSYTFW